MQHHTGRPRGTYKRKVPKTEFAERLRTLCQRTGKTRDEIAAGIGVGPSTLSGWLSEDKSPRLDMAVWCAMYFGVTVGQMAGIEPLTERCIECDAPDHLQCPCD